MALTELDLTALRRWLVAARTDLTTHAEALDRLNVFPVPDGDTGTNMRLTVQQAVRQLAAAEPADLTSAASVLTRAMLLSARGNSGVILSQLVRGLSSVVEADRGRPLDGAALARALRAASDLAWAGVSEPVEGTILSVARAAAEGAEREPLAALIAVSDNAVSAARAALERTTDQLETLRAAGVVDAGGAGYLLVLEALSRVVRGDAGLSDPDRLAGWLPQRTVGAAAPTTSAAHATSGGPAYEVMYLVEDSDAERVAALRMALTALGDSVVIAGGEPLWSVHVHTDQVAAALEAGAVAGRPHRFAVTRFADDPAFHHVPPAEDQRARLIAIVSGEGLADLVRRRGGVALSVASSPTEVAEQLHAGPAVLLCDSPHARELADQIDAQRVAVGGSHPVHVVAALDIVDVTADVEETQAQLDELDTDLQVSSYSKAIDDAVVLDGLAAPLDAGAELVTIVTGDGVPTSRLQSLIEAIQDGHPDVDVIVVEGGAAEPALAVGVE